jgi:hypothetical protein
VLLPDDFLTPRLNNIVPSASRRSTLQVHWGIYIKTAMHFTR